MKISKDILLSRIIATALFVAVIAGTWDVWWHAFIGRDTLWEPPHILLYSSVVLAIILGVYGWQQTRHVVWKRLSILLVLVPLSAPFDELWHRIFGVEDISTIWAVWSPPHIVLAGTIIASFILLLPVIKRDSNVLAVRLFGAMTFAGILSMLFFLASPLQATGPYHVLGFYGAGIVAAIFVGVLIAAKKWVPGIAGATLMIAFFILISVFGFGGEETAPNVKVAPHDHSPQWLIGFSLLIPTVFVDLFAKRSSKLWLIGGIAGLFWGGLLFGFSWVFFEPQFQYTLAEGLTAVVMSVIGGVFAGGVVERYQKKR